MSIKILLLVTIFGFSCTTELTGGRKSIIPRHESEKNVLFHIAEPTEGLYKRSNLGKTFDSGVLHKLEDFLLKKAKDFELASKKSEIEDQKEVETIAESIEAAPSASESSRETKDIEKGVEKGQIVKNGSKENQKKTVVTKQNEVKQGDRNETAEKDAKNKDGMGSKSDESVKDKLKEQLQQSKAKSKQDDAAKSEEKADKKVKKDDVTVKEKVVKSPVLQPRKVKKVVTDNAIKRDKTVPDEDDEYGRLELSDIF